jgi:hypothetical protein
MKLTNPNKKFLIENWFSTPIYSSSSIEWVEKLKPFLLQQLNKDNINKKRFYNGKTTHATNTNLANYDEFSDFTIFLKSHAKVFLDNLGFDYEKISEKFNPYYFTTQLNKGSMQERHIHAFQLSGILYIKVPKTSAVCKSSLALQSKANSVVILVTVKGLNAPLEFVLTVSLLLPDRTSAIS